MYMKPFRKASSRNAAFFSYNWNFLGRNAVLLGRAGTRNAVNNPSPGGESVNLNVGKSSQKALLNWINQTTLEQRNER